MFTHRARIVPILCCVLALPTWVVASAQDTAKPSPSFKEEHPGDTALSKDPSGKWIYKSFPGLQRLYVYDGDESGKSKCNGGCSSAWPPLLVSGSEKDPRVGDWTVIVRDDGRRQWAYKRKPVYTRYHDIEADPGIAKEGFHILDP